MLIFFAFLGSNVTDFVNLSKKNILFMIFVFVVHGKKRTHWSPLEVSVAQKCFSKHIEEGRLPSLSEYRNYIQKNIKLQNRNETQLKL